MAVNKVVYAGQTLIDLTNDTVTPSTLLKGYKAHDKSGAVITGTFEAGETVDDILENGFQSGDITYTDDGTTLTATNNATGQVLTRKFENNVLTSILLSRSGGSELGRLTRTYSSDYSVITSVNSYTGLTTVKTFDYTNMAMTLQVKNSYGTVIKTVTKSWTT